MQEIITNLGSPAWWFSAILIALFINLVSAYAKPTTDKILSKASSTWRNHSAEARRKFEQEVDRLMKSPQALAQASEAEVRGRLQSMLFFFFVFMLLLFTVISGASGSAGALERYTAVWFVVKVATVLTFVFAAVSFREAARQGAAVTSARKLLIRSELRE